MSMSCQVPVAPGAPGVVEAEVRKGVPVEVAAGAVESAGGVSEPCRAACHRPRDGER